LPGNLKYLKEKGYETFKEWFVEDYDNIEGHPQRMYYLTREIVRIANMSHEDLHKKYLITWEKCLHNRKRFFSFDHTQGFKELVGAISQL